MTEKQLKIVVSKRRLYRERKERGYVRKEIWARSEHWPLIMDLIDEVKMGDRVAIAQGGMS